jgi:hypothetical protein
MTPITSAIVETGTFDVRKMIDPDIQGAEYQQGPGYEYENRRHTVLTYFNYTCQYCGTTKGIMTVEHVIPKGKGGTNAWSNLTCACRICNREKNERTPEEAGMPNPETVNPRNPTFLRYCALTQTGKAKLVKELQKFAPTQTVYGWQTKLNREVAKLPKTHYFDALCTRGSTQKPLRLTSAFYEIKLRRRNIRRTHNSNPQLGGPRRRYNLNKTLKVESKCFKKGDLVSGKRGSGYIDTIASSGQIMYRTVLGNRYGSKPEKLTLLESAKGVSFQQKSTKLDGLN